MRAVLVDLDGTLVHLPIDWPAVRESLGGGSVREALRHDPRAHATLAQTEAKAAILAAALPGAAELVRAIKAGGFAWAVVTDTDEDAARIALARIGVVGTHVVGRTGSEPGRLKPELLDNALRLLSVTAEMGVVLVTDTEEDARGAYSRGLGVVRAGPQMAEDVLAFADGFADAILIREDV